MINTTTDIKSRFLLYMDILGGKEITLSEPKRILNLIEKFASNVSSYTEDFIEHQSGMHELCNLQPEFSHFSDHIVVSYPDKFKTIPQTQSNSFILLHSLISITAQIHRIALEYGFIMRGAITHGLLHHHGNMIVGPALIVAENIERKIAVYPRVVLSDSIANMINDEFVAVQQDEGGLYFINYFLHPQFNLIGHKIPESETNCFIESIKKIRQAINCGMKQTSDNMHNRAKWQWVEHKFNNAIKFHIKKYPNCSARLDKQLLLSDSMGL